MEKPNNISFFGVATFAKTPLVKIDSEWQADAAVLGVPFDAGAGYRSGARFGPRAIRDISTRLCFFDPDIKPGGYWDVSSQRRYLEHATMVDCDDVSVISAHSEYTLAETEAAVRKILVKQALPIVLGGDHSVTIPCVRAYRGFLPIDVVHLDAHMDLRDTMMGAQNSHSSVIRRVSEMDHVRQVVSLGIRGLRTSEKDYSWALNRGNIIKSFAECREAGMAQILAQLPPLKNCYVTIDIDCLNVAEAPGTGTPEIGGFNYQEVISFLRGLTQMTNIVGFDVVEVNPNYDVANITALASANLIIEFLGAILG